MATVSQPDPVGGTMHVDTAEFQALRDQVAELAAKLEEYRRKACMVRSLEDIWQDTYPGYLASSPCSPATHGGRHRHLRALSDGAS